MEMPPINQRILQLIECYANNNMVDFSKNIQIPEKNITGLFTIQKKTRKYPPPSAHILIAIINTYPGTNANWLLTGKGKISMKSLFNRIYKQANNLYIPIIEIQSEQIREQAIEIGRLSERIRLIQLKKNEIGEIAFPYI